MPAPVTAAGLAKWAWGHREEIVPKLRQFYRGMRRRVFGRSPGILILGAGGVGKTTLGRILSGKHDFLLDAESAYEQSVGVQTFQQKKKPNIEVVVGPGQEDRRNSTWPKLLASLANGKERGVIMCCAYGYHSLSISYKHHKVFDPKTPHQFLLHFSEDRRKDELRVLDVVAAALQQNPHQSWLLTFVAKEDLWTTEDDGAREFYTTGAYGQRLVELIRTKGNRHFRHEVVFGSMVIQNLATARGELLMQNAAGYDHPRQVRSLRGLFETVAALESWKAQ